MLNVNFVEVRSTISGSTTALASAREPDSISGLNMAEAYASGTGQSNSSRHSVAIKYARGATEA